MTAEPAWLTEGRKDIGFQEQAGNRGIEQFIEQSHTGSVGDPWCAIWANAKLESVGVKGTRSPAANSFTQSPLFIRQQAPQLGTICTFTRTGGNHVAFYTGIDKQGRLLVLGGNQGDKVDIEPHSTDTLTGYWWPAQAATTTLPAPITHPLIMMGATGPSVIELQTLLKITISGQFDAATDVAVRAFQASRGLDVDGEVGPLTWSALLGTSVASDVPHSDEYVGQWNRMIILPEHASAVDAIARKLIANKARYQFAQSKTGVPWAMIAVLHNRESDADFSTQLAQGDPLDRVSTDVPAGRGPFATWEDGACDALVTLKHLDQIRDWSIERVCYECERYNGFGYRNKGVPSAYLWSFSNIYQGGKYIADGVWSATAVDKQCGTMPIIKRMMEIDTSIQFGVSGDVIPPAKPDDEIFIALTFVLSQEGPMDANLKAQMLAELAKPNPDMRGLLAHALSATPAAPTVPSAPALIPGLHGLDFSKIGDILANPLVKKILAGQPVTLADVMPQIPTLLALLQGHAPPPPPPVSTVPDPAPAPSATGMSDTAFNWSTGIGAALTALLGSTAGVIGTPIPGSPDFSLTGLLSFAVPLIAGAFGVPAPAAAMIGNVFKNFKKP